MVAMCTGPESGLKSAVAWPRSASSSGSVSRPIWFVTGTPACRSMAAPVACSSALGRSKVDVTAERLGEINCDVDVIRHRVAAGRQNLPDMLAAVDVVIDALDNIDDRLSLQRACADAGVVMVHGAIAGTALQVATIYPGEAGLEGMLPPTDGEGKAQGVEVETGNPATTPVLAAVIQVQEAVKVLVGTGTTLRGKMLYLDLEDWTFEFIEL